MKKSIFKSIVSTMMAVAMVITNIAVVSAEEVTTSYNYDFSNSTGVVITDNLNGNKPQRSDIVMEITDGVLKATRTAYDYQTSGYRSNSAKAAMAFGKTFSKGTVKAQFDFTITGEGNQGVLVSFDGYSPAGTNEGVVIRRELIQLLRPNGVSTWLNYNTDESDWIQDGVPYTVTITLDIATAKYTVNIVNKNNTSDARTKGGIQNFAGYSKGDITGIVFYSPRNTDMGTGVMTFDNLKVDIQTPANAAETIDWEMISNNQPQTEVLDKLNLVKNMKVGSTDYAIQWESSDTSAISANGVVTPGETEKTVTLTATDTAGNKKQFTVTVPSASVMEKYLVRANFDNYALGDARKAMYWTHKYHAYNTCYTNFNVVEDGDKNALHVERTVFKSGGYKDQTGATVEGVNDPDASDRIMPAMKANITADKKIQIDTRVKFLDEKAALGIRFDGLDASGFAPILELNPKQLLNPMDGFKYVSFTSSYDVNEYIDYSIVMDFASKQIKVTATGKSNGSVRTQTISSGMSKVVTETLDIDSIGLIYRRDASPSYGSYVGYFRVKDITESPLDVITWDAISNAQGIANVTEAVKLDKKITYNGTDYNVTWTSSNETVITSNGAVARPFVDTAVKLTATLDNGASKTFNTVVRSTEPALVASDFDEYNVANGTIVNGLGGEWEETYPGGALKGVNYTVAQDPTDADNQVMKVERYIMKRNNVWVDGTTDTPATGAYETYNGPQADDRAKITFAEPVTEGKVTLTTRIMFTEGSEQSIDFFLYDLYDVDANNNVLLLDRTGFKFYGYKNSYISYGGFKAIPHVWYNVAFTLDLDNGTYELKIGDLTFSGIEAIANDDMEQLSAIGIYPNRTNDTVAKGTSVWYVDDVVVKKGLSNANAVKLAKDELALPETVTGDITLPTAGLEETTISWTTSDADVITKGGVVTYNSEDKTVKLTATITKGTATETKEFTVTVKGVKPYAIKAVNVLTPNGDMGKSLVGGGKIQSVDIYKHYAIEDTAKAYVALYNGDGKLYDIVTADIKSDAVGVKERATVTFNEAITLPNDISGLTMKVFVWNGIVPAAEAFNNATPETDVFIIGDSIACWYPASAYPQQGWGEYIGGYFNDKVTIHNKAHGGYSTRTYLETTSTDNWATVKPQITSGDYVLISLGFNDANTGSDTRYTSIDQYKENLRIFIRETRALNATPILITNTVALQATSLEQTQLPRVKAMSEVASEMGVVCLNINEAMYNAFQGKDLSLLKSEYYIAGDYLHFNETGANYVAGIIIDLLGGTDSELAKYIK